MGEDDPFANKETDFRAKLAFEIADREGFIPLYQQEGSIVGHADPAIRAKIVDLLRQELEILTSLDPSTTSIEEIDVIGQRFEALREAL